MNKEIVLQETKEANEQTPRNILIDMRSKIELDAKTFSHLNAIWRMAVRKNNIKFTFNFKSTTLFSPALLAPFGVLLGIIKGYNNHVIFTNVDKNILPFNPFTLSAKSRVSYMSSDFDYIYTKAKDPDEQKFFENYVKNMLFRYVPDKSAYNFNRLEQSIFELHENIKTHTRAKYFAISSHYCEKSNLLIFSIANFGRSIPDKLADYGFHFDSKEQALLYALQKGHTTKLSSSGGLGLYVISQFINDVSGELHIVSGEIYMVHSNNSISFKSLTSFYPGTNITLTVPLNALKKESISSKSMLSIKNLWEMI